MKEINATTTYDPACSDMQEVEYTMPQSKRDITKCLMIALDNFAEAQAEIDKILNDVSDMECSCLPYAEQTGDGVCPRCRLMAKYRR